MLTKHFEKDIYNNGKSVLFLSHVRYYATKVYFQKCFKVFKILQTKLFKKYPLYGKHTYVRKYTHTQIHAHINTHTYT